MEYVRFTLANGLRVIHHPIPESNTVTLNILYNVGARDESPERTGFAHLFEHLMFGGSLNIPNYDQVVEWAGGNNNAFTNNDYTNYYVNVPLENAEQAFWLESDRMLGLAFSEESLRIQKGVVIEEFKQRCHNAPFGMLWHHIRSLAYKVHPYRWPTIGLTTNHIETASLSDVMLFYERFYHPKNAVLCVGGALKEAETRAYCERWFGTIDKPGERNQNLYPLEPVQLGRQFLETTDLLPQKAVFMAFRTPPFQDGDWPTASMFSELIGGTETSPLYVELVKERRLFSAAESFYMKGLSEGLFVVYGILEDQISHSTGEAALSELIERYRVNLFTDAHLLRVKEQMCTRLLFEDAHAMNRVQKLCYYEHTDTLESVLGKEVSMIGNVKQNHLCAWAETHLKESAANVIFYSPK
jgi:predicted Zn-dependent peptidase